eukprot:gene9031-9111_t
MKKIIITGGAGFIGSHVVRRFVKNYPAYQIVNLDKLTYAGNLANLRDIEGEPNYKFVKGDIVDIDFINQLFADEQPDAVIHLAAESHVDRSITNPLDFVMTNVVGTVNLLNAARHLWKERFAETRFYHVSTDEVYGTLGDEGMFTEQTGYDPHSPYSASKAGSDHFVRAYHDTYGLDTVISNCSNNYGSYHFPEKLIPLAINNIKQSKPVPVYGKGENIRDWLWVEDHARAIDVIFHQAKAGSTYNIGGHNEWKNIDLIKLLCSILDKKLGRAEGESEKLITFVTDRAGHDLRYAIDASKLKNELGWVPSITFEEGLEKTVDWYLNNEEWLDNVTSGQYQQYYSGQYNHSSIGVDMHSHVLPGIDDGAQTPEESIALIKKMMALGIRKIIATPHIMADYYRNTPDTINDALKVLKAELKAQSIDIVIEAAAEHYFDETFEGRPPNAIPVIQKMTDLGYKPILAHPERYPYMDVDQFKALHDWGVSFQINTISLTGYYGRESKKLAESLIDQQLIDFISSDMHHLRHAEALKNALRMPYLEKVLFDYPLKNIMLK